MDKRRSHKVVARDGADGEAGASKSIWGRGDRADDDDRDCV